MESHRREGHFKSELFTFKENNLENTDQSMCLLGWILPQWSEQVQPCRAGPKAWGTHWNRMKRDPQEEAGVQPGPALRDRQSTPMGKGWDRRAHLFFRSSSVHFSPVCVSPVWERRPKVICTLEWLGVMVFFPGRGEGGMYRARQSIVANCPLCVVNGCRASVGQIASEADFLQRPGNSSKSCDAQHTSVGPHRVLYTRTCKARVTSSI